MADHCKINITIIGNSVTNRMRPPRTLPDEGTYPEELQKLLGSAAHVTNMGGWSRVISQDLLGVNQIVNTFPRVLVINFGVNECAPRILPQGLWRLIHAEYFGPAWIRRGLHFLGRVLGGVTPILVKWTRARSWYSCRKFGELLESLLAHFEKELQARVIVLNIGQPSERVEAALPGIGKNVTAFNSEIAHVVSRFANAELLDVFKIVERFGASEILPDGIHFNARGHRLVAEELAWRIGSPQAKQSAGAWPTESGQGGAL